MMWVFLAAIQNPPPTAGSSLWQLVFISFACVLVLFEVLRGWRRGLARQFARLGALMAAYFAAYFGGNLLVPLVRPLLKMPDAVLSILAGAALALAIYATINTLGTMLFRRTGQHDSFVVRIVYGVTGAVLGLFFGTFLVWLMVVSVRLLGAVADAQVRQQATAPGGAAPARSLHAVDVRRRLMSESNEESAPLMTTLARLKNSLELGTVGEAVKKSDIVPGAAYDTLRKVSMVLSDSESVRRFLSFPGAQELAQHSKIVALRDDPEIADMIAQGRFYDLLHNQKILDAANDSDLVQEIKYFNLQEGLDYALKRE
jgi:uncharacterized membrane protein required for colicin V production/uncharacterized protein YerC